MSEHTRTSQGWFARLCGGISPGRFLAAAHRARKVPPAAELNARLQRDIGHHIPMLPDRRSDHYRLLLRRGYPLG